MKHGLAPTGKQVAMNITPLYNYLGWLATCVHEYKATLFQQLHTLHPLDGLIAQLLPKPGSGTVVR